MFERKDRYLGIGIILTGIFCYIQASGWKVLIPADPAGPGAIPKILSVSFIVIGSILIVGPLYIKNKDTGSGEKKAIDKKASPVMISLATICFAYLFLLPYIGYLLATPLLIISVMTSMGVRNTRTLLLVGIVSTLILFIIFYYFLRVNLPLGVTRALIRRVGLGL